MAKQSTQTTATNKLIDRMVRRIVRKFRPEKVILFGSHARNDAGPDSDVDLLVVMEVEGSRDATRRAIRADLPDNDTWIDLIVTTPEDFRWRQEIVGTIEWPAVREGKVLYARTEGSDSSRKGMDRKGGKRPHNRRAYAHARRRLSD